MRKDHAVGLGRWQLRRGFIVNVGLGRSLAKDPRAGRLTVDCPLYSRESLLDNYCIAVLAGLFGTLAIGRQRFSLRLGTPAAVEISIDLADGGGARS